MAAATDSATSLAYDDEGAGTPVVFLHGLTFDRRTWRPIIERLDGSVRSIAIDLPAHGDSGGAPAQLDEFAAQVHELLGSLAVDRPIVVGHSMSGGLASFYAAAYPTPRPRRSSTTDPTSGRSRSSSNGSSLRCAARASPRCGRRSRTASDSNASPSPCARSCSKRTR